MPLYEYACDDCGHRFEVLQALGAGGEGLDCPGCGSRTLVKQFSTFAGSVPGGRNSGGDAASGGAGCCRGTPT